MAAHSKAEVALAEARAVNLEASAARDARARVEDELRRREIEANVASAARLEAERAAAGQQMREAQLTFLKEAAAREAEMAAARDKLQADMANARARAA